MIFLICCCACLGYGKQKGHWKDAKVWVKD
jgi:hypothetical protein